MSFPIHLRNGSTDHIPPRIGKGLGDMTTNDKERGLYFKIDDQNPSVLFWKRSILYCSFH